MKRTQALMLAVAASFGTAPALAELDVAIGNGDRVIGAIDGADEETYRIAVPGGAVLSVSVKGKKSKGAAAPPMTLQVLDPGDTDVAAGLVTHRGTGAKAKLDIADSAVYRVVVSSVGNVAGGYQISAKWKSSKRVVISDAFGGPPDQFTVVFGVDRGALASFEVKPAKGSAAQPFLFSVGNDEFETAFDSPDPGFKKHKVKKVAMEGAGDVTLVVRNAGADGEVVGKITVKPPKVTKRKVTITDQNWVNDDGIEVVSGEIVDAAGGLVAPPPGSAGPIAGAAIDVPPGALARPTALFIGTSPAFEPKDGNVAAFGEPIHCGPDGLKFDVPVDVTIPFDPTPFNGDFSTLQVFTKDSKGKVTLVPPPYAIDPAKRTVSFPTSNFSSFQVFGPQGSVVPAPAPDRDIDGDDVDDLVLAAPGFNQVAGRVLVFSGGPAAGSVSASDADFVLTGAMQGGFFGKFIAIGDVLGDDQEADLLVSSEEAQEGRVSVFRGGVSFDDAASTTAEVNIDSAVGDFEFGTRVEVADVNDDGDADVIVGAAGGAQGNGVVKVYFGPLLQDRTVADVTFTGESNGDGFGFGLATGDVTGDLVADVVVGAPMFNVSSSTGKVYVFPGGKSIASASAATAPVILVGEPTVGTSSAAFGQVVRVGNLIDDGVGDVVASGIPSDGATVPGHVYVFAGGATLSSRDADAADVVITGSGSIDLLGEALQLADVTGNGTLDIVAGALDGGVGNGAVHVFDGGALQSGPAAAGTLRILGDAGSAFVGAALAAPVRIGGRQAIVIADVFNSAGGAQSGRVYVFVGAPATGTAVGNADTIIDGDAEDLLGGINH